MDDRELTRRVRCQVHPGYLASNAPLRHVSTSRAGTFVAVAGSRGLAIYNRPTNRWRLFGNIEQVRLLARPCVPGGRPEVGDGAGPVAVFPLGQGVVPPGARVRGCSLSLVSSPLSLLEPFLVFSCVCAVVQRLGLFVSIY